MTMIRTVIRLGIIVLFVVAAYGSAQVVDQKHVDLTRELARDAAERFDLPDGVRVSLSTLEEGRFDWQLSVADDISDYLDGLGIEPQGDRLEQLVEWSRRVHRECFELTLDRVQPLDEHFNPHTDFKLTISGWALANQEPERKRGGYVSITWEGTELSVIYDTIGRESGSGRHVYPERDAGLLDGVEMTVEISIDDTSLLFREALTGTVTLRNTGRTRIPYRNGGGPRELTVLHADGTEAEATYRSMGTAHPPMPEWWVRFLMPGESVTEPFVLHGDIAEAPVFDRGYEMPVGSYELIYKDSEWNYNLNVKSEPVRFEVYSEADGYLGPRASWVLQSEDDLLVFRSGGWIERLDPRTGKRHSVLHRQNVYPGSFWGGSNIEFSPDGALVAFGSFRDDPIEVIALADEPHVVASIPMTGELRPEHKNGHSFIAGFSPDNRLLYVSNSRGVHEFHVESGERLRLLPFDHMLSPILSPGGDFLVSKLDVQGRFANGGGVTLEGPVGRGADATLTIMPTAKPETAQEAIVRGHGEMPLVMLGLRGAYLNHGRHAGVAYQPYNGDEAVLFDTDRVSVEAESADGSLVAFASPGGPAYEEWFEPHGHTTTIEVWDVVMREKLYEIKAEAQQRARFVGTPALLVVLERDFTTKPKWFDETVRLYAGRTGDFIRRVNVAPKHDFAALDTVPTP